jgi:aminoglycoside phosphotransferase (APT) family kinase protein
VVSRRIVGVPLFAALANPAQRGAALSGVVAKLRALREIDATGIHEPDLFGHARRGYETQRARPGFPAWASALEPIFDAIAAALARDPRRVVSHNDANPGNILWDGARAWFVDWEVSGLAHPFYDLAVLAMFLRLDDDAACALLAELEQRPVEAAARETFATLRRFAALFCGLTFASMVPDLAVLPASPPTLKDIYAEFHAGTLDIRQPRAHAAFSAALMHLGVSGAGG